MRETIARVRQYELMAIFSPEISEEDLQAAIERVSEIVAEAGANVSLINRESPWGRRRLSYPIRHNSHDVRDGYYVLYYADIDTQHVSEIERDLKLMEPLMRYLITQQVAEQMIPESMKPDDDSIAGITAADNDAADAAAAASAEAAKASSADEPAVEAAPAVAEADVAPAAAEAASEEASSEAAPATEEAAGEPAPATEETPAEAAPATEETADEPADASGEDTTQS